MCGARLVGTVYPTTDSTVQDLGEGGFVAKVETGALRSAASSIRSGAVPKAEALKSMTNDTEVAFPHFGVALFMVNNSYQDFRTYMIGSINAMHEQLVTVADQIDLAAKHWEDVEAAIARGLKTP